MIESDITRNMSDCEDSMQKPACDAHHPDCTCDDCCQSSRSICEDRDCAETQQPSEGKTKMRNKLVPILANCVVLLAAIGISGRIIEARLINHSPENSAVAIANLAGNIAARNNQIRIISNIGITTITPTARAIAQRIDG